MTCPSTCAPCNGTDQTLAQLAGSQDSYRASVLAILCAIAANTSPVITPETVAPLVSQDFGSVNPHSGAWVAAGLIPATVASISKLTVVSTLDKALHISIDGGSTAAFVVPPGQTRSFTFSPALTIDPKVRYSGTAGTSGTVVYETES